MRRLAGVASVAAALFLGATSAWAQPDAVAQEHLKNLRFLLGDWDLTGEMHWAGQQAEPLCFGVPVSQNVSANLVLDKGGNVGPSFP